MKDKDKTSHARHPVCRLIGRRILGVIVLTLAVAPPLAAFQAKPGFVKVELSSMSNSGAPIPAVNLIAGLGADDVADYGSFHLVYVPKGLITALQTRAAAAGVNVRVRDELDRIDAPSASIDVRVGVQGAPPGGLIRGYPETQTGLYLLQLAGPAQTEWFDALRSVGWTIAGDLRSDAYIVAGRPALVAPTRKLPFVQFLDFYHPFEKSALFRENGKEMDLIMELPACDGRQPTIDAIAQRSLTVIRVDSYSNETYVHARLSGTDATQLLSDPLVISISPEPNIGLSDERVALSLTTSVSADGKSAIDPQSQGGTAYSSWLTTNCPNCSATNMPSATWRVGIADTGLDSGSGANVPHHQDLVGREYWGASFMRVPEDCGSTCGKIAHGTMVAGIIAGNATAHSIDINHFLDGEGIAPAAGIFSTKIFSSNSGNLGDIHNWATDATSNSVYIQNHSHNDYNNVAGSTSGLYTVESQLYDYVTRDSDNNTANGVTPILLTVSAGNIDQETQPPGTPRTQALPPATAKNVIAMGGAENDRMAWAGNTTCHGAAADGFTNIFGNSMRGTATPGYIKPDMVAPATIIAAALTTVPNYIGLGCYTPFVNDPVNNPTVTDPGYAAQSGTSFAAPVAAAASILVRRFAGSTPSSLSPALTKAYLIANARSIRSGVDHLDGQTVGAVPNVRQGFGRLTLEHLFSQVSANYDQGTHLTTGQTWRSRYAVHDSTQPVTVALVWSDAPGSVSGTLTGPTLVNDLDLTIAPRTTTCTHMYGNNLVVNNQTTGEESQSFPCTQTVALDNVNNVEYARFFVNGYTQFDVTVSGHTINGIGDPVYPTAASPSNNQDFAIVLMNADVVTAVPPDPPTAVTATTQSDGKTVSINWNAVTGATGYQLQRSTSWSGTFTNAGSVISGSPATDLPPSSSTTAYVYRVLAYDGANYSDPSNRDYATVGNPLFNDPTITAGPTGTGIKKQHVVDLRAAVDAVRVALGTTAATWTDPLTYITAASLNEVRNRLDDARNLSGVALGNYPYSSAVTQNSAILKLHMDETRQAVR